MSRSEWMCRVKRRYPDAVAARVARAKQRYRHRVYHCPECGGFHLTTQRR